MMDGRWEPGWIVYGCPMGTDAYVAHMLDKKVEELAEGAKRACEVLEEESQALWAVLRLSLQQQFGYWISLVHPTQVAGAADRVDSILCKVLEKVAGSVVPQASEDLAYTCPVGPEVGWLEGRSFQSIISRPVVLDSAACSTSPLQRGLAPSSRQCPSLMERSRSALLWHILQGWRRGW